jgi:2-dehydropantoate 2-reductase
MANISVAIDADDRVVHLIPLNNLVYGEISGGISPRVNALHAVMDGVGFNARASDMVMQDMWEKFAQLGVGAGITCLMRTSIGDIMAAPGGRDATLRLFDECGAVASAAGYKPRDAFVQNSLALVTAAGSPLKWSMLRDIERGSTTEGEHILGDMVARARALGVKTPILDLARTHVAAYEIDRSRAAVTL